MADADKRDLRTEELTGIIREIRDRVRARHPSGEAGESAIPLADLTPLIQARDTAEAKVAAIGTVNPRRPGPINFLVQRAKRMVARALDWHVREQVEFNRAIVDCVNTTIESLNETNHAIARLSTLQDDLRRHVTESLEGPVMDELREQKDIRSHWDEWRRGWEENLAKNEIQFLRGLTDLRAAYDHRVSQIEANLGSEIRAQHKNYVGALDRASLDVQKRLWDDLERIRTEYEKLIHNEIRVLRQRALARSVRAETALPANAAPAAPESPVIDYLRFADRFRGSEEYVKKNQQIYVERFRGCGQVLDIGCGRGEFLEVLRAASIPGRGIDLDEEFVNICKSKGLEAAQADLFEHLDGLDDDSLDGIFSAQVIEHLPPARLPELVTLAARKLRHNGVIAIETPNPECLAIFATHFYLDPTHRRPVPSALTVFYLEEAGFGRIEVLPLSPAEESLPSVTELPEGFRKAFFGGLDYAVIARRL